MRLWLWTAFVLVVTLLVATFLQIPFWLFVVVVIPLLVFVFTYSSVSYSFRESLQPQRVPEPGYGSRTKALDVETTRMTPHGFEKVDFFYLQMIPDAVVYVLKHMSEPVYLCFYHLGQKITSDFVTRYENEYTLTTCSSIDSGMMPRPAKHLLQIMNGVSHEELYSLHKKAHSFLFEKGLRSLDVPTEEFRSFFMMNIRKQASLIRKLPLWPFQLVIWILAKRGRRYQAEIEMQYKKNMVQLHDTR
jgi:hypothetical protein